MKRFLQSLVILSLLALVSAPAFAVGYCWQCTCSSSCSRLCVDPDGSGSSCLYWACQGQCLAVQSASVQVASASVLSPLPTESGLGDLCKAPVAPAEVTSPTGE